MKMKLQVAWQLRTGRRDRLALALTGILTLAVGLAVMSMLTASATGIITKSYEQTWRAPYDILVHVPLRSTETVIPEIMEPNILSTLPPGISAAQYETIRTLDGVDIAAPLAVIGAIMAGPKGFPVVVEDLLQPLAPGLYNLTASVQVSSSNLEAIAWSVKIQCIEKGTTPYCYPVTDLQGSLPEAPPSWKKAWTKVSPLTPDGKFLLLAWGTGLSPQVPRLVVGVDPTEESRLVGLSNAISQGQMLDSQKSVQTTKRELPADWFGTDASWEAFVVREYETPVLVNIQGFQGIQFERLIRKIHPSGKLGEVVYERSLQDVEIPEEQQRQLQYDPFGTINSLLLGNSGTLSYQPSESPFPDRWPLAFKFNPVSDQDLLDQLKIYERGSAWTEREATLGQSFRTWQPAEGAILFPDSSPWWHSAISLQFNIAGYIDPSRLEVTKNPDSQLPLMTYRPAEATLVLDPEGRPINPPKKVSGGLSPVGFLTSPPVYLTTLKAAEAIHGDGVINAIRVKVKGANDFTPETVARVKQVAREIEKQTGLVAEVVMGSSPVNVLIEVPASGEYPALGWVEQQWVHKNAGVTTVQQAEFGLNAFIALVLLVALLFGITTGLAGVTARRRELGILAAVGWPMLARQRPAVEEQLAFGLVAGVLAAAASAFAGAEPVIVGITFAVGVLAYGPAALAVRIAVDRMAEGEALRWGDTAPGRRVIRGGGAISLALASLFGRPGRTVLTIIAIALPTALILVLATISLTLQGSLYTTLPGQYAVLEVAPLQYISGLIALGIAAVTAFDLIRQIAIDHRNERALLHALGWPRYRIALTMIWEGALLGLAAGILGDTLGLLGMAALYRQGVVGALRVAVGIWLLPLLVGLLTGALTSLLELRSWNQSALTGVGCTQVLRLGRKTVVVGLTVLLIGLGLIGGSLLPDLVAKVGGSRAVPPSNEDSLASDAVALPNAIAACEARWSEPVPFAAPSGRLRPELGERPKGPGPNANYSPHSYDIEARYEPSEHRLTGTVTLSWQNGEGIPVDTLYFNLWPNAPMFTRYGGRIEVHEVWVNGQPVDFRALDLDLAVPLGAVAPPEETVEVTIAFETTLPEQTTRRMLGQEDGRFYLIHWFPNLAVLDDQGWNLDPLPESYPGEPYSESARYRVQLTVPAGYTVVATGSPLDRIEQDGQWTYTFEAPNVRDFVAAGGRDLPVYERQAGEVTVRVLSGDPTWAEEQSSLVAEGLEYFNTLFGPYPYRDLVVAEGPGIEFPQFFFTPQAGDRSISPGTTLHELAHQWFYGAVGNDAYDEPWLDEGFAEYGRWKALQALRPNEPLLPASPGAYPPGIQVTSSAAEIGPTGASFRVLYQGGAQVLLDLEEEMGEDGFRELLQEYVRRFRYQTATTRDFLQMAETFAGQNLEEFFRSHRVQDERAQRVDSSSPPVQDPATAARLIEAALAWQNGALGRGDLPAFLATVDRNSPEYWLERYHWFEDAQVWQEEHPQGIIERQLDDAEFLGSRTARVQITELFSSEDDTESVTWTTLWVETAEGCWLEYGLDHSVFRSPDGRVQVWYPKSITDRDARTTAEETARVLATLRNQLGWRVNLPVTVEFLEDPIQAPFALGPHLAPVRGVLPWVRYGEPLRLQYQGQAPSQTLLTYALVYKAVQDMSNNHVAEWFKEGLNRYAMVQVGEAPLESYVKNLKEPLPLTELPARNGVVDLPPEEWEAVGNTSLLFTVYLEEQHGAKTLSRILDQLAQAPPDPRMFGPETFDERNQATIQAIEEVTGLTWSEVEQEFETWSRGFLAN